jgi:hypothetical protein
MLAAMRRASSVAYAEGDHVGYRSVSGSARLAPEMTLMTDSVEKVLSCEKPIFSGALVRSWKKYVRGPTRPR